MRNFFFAAFLAGCGGALPPDYSMESGWCPITAPRVEGGSCGGCNAPCNPAAPNGGCCDGLACTRGLNTCNCFLDHC